VAVIYALPTAPRSFSGSPGTAAVVDANTDFAIDLYQKLKSEPGNLFFSPYSISSALAMTYAGARGQTESEMAKVLHFDPGQTNVHAGFRALTDRINNLQRINRIKLLTANSLWNQKNYPFTGVFLNLVQQDYQAEVRLVDFVKAPDAAVNDINAWVDRKTDGKIQNIIGEGGLDPMTRLVLCNAIYFKGKWKTPFNPGDTQPYPFYVTSNETVTVPMMSLHDYFKIARSEDNQLLEMPYVGGDLSMIIIMPGRSELAESDDPSQSLSMLEKKFTAANLNLWLRELDQAQAGRMEIMIPRFTTTQSFNLSGQLESLGMPSAFNPGKADFSGMDGTTSLFISDVLHKAYVAVDESGTEAAAATATVMVSAAEPDEFIANQPFIFLIRDNGSGAILFLGRIVDPTK
jgi:serpin B